MSQTKVQFASELLADALEQDLVGRDQFESILALTIQDELDRYVNDNTGTATLNLKEIVEVAQKAAADFTATITNQND